MNYKVAPRVKSHRLKGKLYEYEVLEWYLNLNREKLAKEGENVEAMILHSKVMQEQVKTELLLY